MTRLFLLAHRFGVAERLPRLASSDRALLASMSWLTVVSGVERFAAVVQTVLVAQALGITAYGVYGLIFGTVGLVASTAGLQMGLTATVFVARYRQTEKAKAAYVISFATRFGLAIALGFLVCTLPFSAPLSAWLLGSVPSAQAGVVAGCLLVALSVVSGVQDGIIQGFEDFRSAALARLSTTLITVLLVYPAGLQFGLVGVLAVGLTGPLVKIVYLSRRQLAHRRMCGLPDAGGGLVARDLLCSFSIPSVLVSLLVGVIGWSGSLVLSWQVNGFDGVAIVNTGLHWRGPILMMASVVSTVAVPAISRHYQQIDHSAINRMLRRMIAFNGVFALLVSLALIAASPLILALYGRDFAGGTVVFGLLVLSSLPQVIAGVYMQNLVAKGRMWQQLWLHFWLVIPLGAGYFTMVPRFHSIGFAVTYLVGWSTFAVALAMFSRIDEELLTADGSLVQVS